MNTQTFDTLVIGSGSSAYFAITALNKAGQKVAVIDERPYGGTCALRRSRRLTQTASSFP